MSNSKIKLRQVPLEHLFTQLARVQMGREARPLMKSQDDLGLQASCINCLHWQTKGANVGPHAPKTKHSEDLCKKFNAMPPPHVIALSCDAWEDIDDIPF